MRKFFLLSIKELRELMTPQMILPLVISIFIFMFIGQVVVSQTEKIEKEKASIGVLNEDGSELSNLLIDELRKQDFKVKVYRTSLKEALEDELKRGGSFVIKIPEDFEKRILSGKQGEIELYTYLSSFSYAGVQKASKVKAVIMTVNEIISSSLLAGKLELNLNEIQQVKNPVKFKEVVQIGKIKAEGSSEAVLGFVSTQGSFIPIILTVVIVFSAQSVAAAIASEKENKTLETLLAAPVSRTAIALSKMFASAIVALLAAVLYIFGFRYYISKLASVEMGVKMGAELSKIASRLNLQLSALDYFLLGLMIFLSIMVALGIAIILGSFTDSVKSVQAVITPLMILILIPYLLTLFTDIETLPNSLKLFVYAIPFTHSLLSMQNLFFHRYDIVLFGILYQAVLFSILLVIVRSIFSTDRILTMKVSFKKA
jgi:ABC-2 type transport system permease protein